MEGLMAMFNFWIKFGGLGADWLEVSRKERGRNP
jgi:hypothetical protein